MNKNELFNKMILELKESFDKNKKFVGLLYFAINTPSFNDITDMKKFLEDMPVSPSMLLIISPIDKKELQIYEWDYKEHTFVDNKIIIKLRHKEEEILLY